MRDYDGRSRAPATRPVRPPTPQVSCRVIVIRSQVVVFSTVPEPEPDGCDPGTPLVGRTTPDELPSSTEWIRTSDRSTAVSCPYRLVLIVKFVINKGNLQMQTPRKLKSN